MVRDIGSAAAAHALYRKRGAVELRKLKAALLTDDLGERDGRAMLYSFSEVVQMAVAVTLRSHGMRAAAAFAVARKHAPQIHAALSPSAAGDPLLTIVFDDRLSDGYASQLSDLGHQRTSAPPPAATVVLGVNIALLAEQVIGRLREFNARQPS